MTCQMVFTSVSGHINQLEFEERYKNWACDPFELFTAPVLKVVQKVRVMDEWMNGWIHCWVWRMREENEGLRVIVDVVWLERIIRGSSPR